MHNGERQKRGVLFFVCFSGSMKMFATFFPGSFSYAVVKYNHRKEKHGQQREFPVAALMRVQTPQSSDDDLVQLDQDSEKGPIVL